MEIKEFKDEKLGPALKQRAKESACILAINVDQDYHQDADFDDTVRIINQSFSFCVIVVVDTPHGYTDAMKLPITVLKNPLQLETEIEKKKIAAANRGKEWVNKIEARWRGEGVDPKVAMHVARFTIPFVITYWDEWTKDFPPYQTKRNYINAMYNLNRPDSKITEEECLSLYGSPMIEDLDTSADIVVYTFVGGFLRKLQREAHGATQKVEFDLNTANILSREYLLSELAMVDLWRSKCYPASVSEHLSRYENVYLTYFFGQNSTNKDIFNCFSKFCSSNFELLTLSKITKQPKPANHNQVSGDLSIPKKIDFGRPDNIINLTKQDRDEQIAALHGAPDSSSTNLDQDQNILSQYSKGLFKTNILTSTDSAMREPAPSP